jgi:hypothetical protein
MRNTYPPPVRNVFEAGGFAQASQTGRHCGLVAGRLRELCIIAILAHTGTCPQKQYESRL